MERERERKKAGCKKTSKQVAVYRGRKLEGGREKRKLEEKIYYFRWDDDNNIFNFSAQMLSDSSGSSKSNNIYPTLFASSKLLYEFEHKLAIASFGRRRS